MSHFGSHAVSQSHFRFYSGRNVCRQGHVSGYRFGWKRSPVGRLEFNSWNPDFTTEKWGIHYFYSVWRKGIYLEVHY